MKFLKWLLIVVASLFLLVVVIGFFQPEHMYFERTKVISATPEEVFPVLNNTREFKKWSPWQDLDTNIVYNYRGPESGKGAGFTWKSPNGEAGYGDWEITGSQPNSRVDLTFKYEDADYVNAGYNLKPVGTNQTEVTWFLDAGKSSNPFSRFGSMMMKFFLDKDFEKGLDKLDAYMKTKPAIAAGNAQPKGRVASIRQEEFKGGHALSMRGPVEATAIGAALGQRYSEMGVYMKTKGLTMSGPPFAWYHTWDGTSTDMEAAVWIDKADKGAGQIKGMTVPAGKVVVADYYGPYMGSELAHFEIDAWAKKNNVKLAASPWEEYITDPMVEKDPMKVLTRVYYRVMQ